MRVTVAAVGKPRNESLAAAIRDYESRAARYWPLDVFEVREERARSVAPALVKAREGERMMSRLTSTSGLVACEPGGREMTSEEFAQWLQGERAAERDVCFAIGGALGLGDEVRAAASLRLSFGTWTLPHELARLVLAEQLYRAGTILRGEPYHK